MNGIDRIRFLARRPRMKKYIVELTADERSGLEDLIKKGNAAAYKIKHANILLKADQAEGGAAWRDEQIVEAFGGHVTTIANPRGLLEKQEDQLHGLLQQAGKTTRPRPDPNNHQRPDHLPNHQPTTTTTQTKNHSRWLKCYRIFNLQ
jgi:hypothetical protein